MNLMWCESGAVLESGVVRESVRLTAASKKSSFVVKNAGHTSQFVGGGGGSRERKGFMVKVVVGAGSTRV